ncbi:YgaB family protein [Heyndrickxia coagulans]|uniref:YgaB family protein n=1 Tax=Heyndrickxia coagulans TaxID=1398 RepID=UPI0002F74F21|nr:YgaB family protein [Heyndrickxia coagulans]MED4311168.1 YgaB family protein [Heyndrickxia coagulans]
MMEEFNRLVAQQMDTMDRLLFLQSEMERCNEVKSELLKFQEETMAEDILDKIGRMNKELQEIEKVFESQTVELIRVYRSSKICT